VIPILKLISNLSQALIPLLSFEMVGFAAFMIAVVQNTLIGIDTRRESPVRETPQKTN